MKLFTHTRMGDLCICYGFLKEFSKQYEITEHLLDDDMFDDEFTEYHD